MFSLLFSNFVISQNYDFKILDSLIVNNKENEAKLLLNKYYKTALKQNDTLTLFLIYDDYIRIYEKDTLFGKEKKFILDKILLIKSYQKNHTGENNNITKLLINTYVKLADYFLRIGENYSSIDILQRALVYAENIEDFTTQVKILSKIGDAYNEHEKYKESLNCYNLALKRARILGDSTLVFDVFINIGDLYSSFGDFSSAVFKYYEAFSIADFQNDTKRQAVSLTYIAKAFYRLRLYNQAVEYIDNSLEIYDNFDSVFSKQQLMEQYILLGKCLLEIENIDLAVNNFNNALYIAQGFSDYKTIAEIYSLLGVANTMSGNFVLAEGYLKKSLLIRQKQGDVLEISRIQFAYGNYYYAQENYEDAKYYLINSFKIAQKYGEFDLKQKTSELLAKIYQYEDNYKLAYEYQQYSIYASDSLFRNNNLFSVKQLEIEHDFRQKSISINEKLNTLTENKNRLVVFVILLSVLLVAFLVAIFFFIIKAKESARGKVLIEKQKQIILKQYDRYKLLSLVASHTDNSIFIMDDKWKIVWVNDALLSIYKTTRYEILTVKEGDFKKLTHTDFEEIQKICIEDKNSYTYTTIVKVEDVNKWIQTTISPIVEEDIVVNLIGIESDITSLKKAQDEIQLQKKDIEYKNKLMDIYNKELKEQQEAIIAQNEELQQQSEELQSHSDLLEEVNKELSRLSVVASETDNIVYIFDLAGNLVWVNNAFSKHTGYTLEEYKQEFGGNIIKASLVESIDYYFYSCIEQKKSVTYVSEVKTKYGKAVWMQTTLSPLTDKKGNVVEIVGIDADITEVKNAERLITEKNMEIKSSLEYARRIQRSVFPLPIFVKAVFDNYFILNKPKDIVSGDFYFVHYVDNKAFFALADCTGHGIPGAFMSLLGSMALKIIFSNIDNYSVNNILSKLNFEMIRLLHQRSNRRDTFDSIDMAFCAFDFKNNTLDYAGANIPLYTAIKHDDGYSIGRIRPTKATIGYDKLDKYFTVHSLKMKKGDRIYLTTDGLPDQFGGHLNKKLKRKGAVALFEDINRLPINEQENALNLFLNKWMGANPQVDDIMVVGIEY